MSNRLGKRLSTFWVALFAGGILAIAVQDYPARADNTCLEKSGPTTPRGHHWRYRVEPGTKRHCWYLGKERGKVAQETAAKPVPSVPAPDKPALTSSPPPLRPSITNAHAEFDGATSAKDSADANPLPSTTDSSDEVAQNATTSQPTATTQWPDPVIPAAPVVNAAQPSAQAAVAPDPQAPNDPPAPAATIEPATQALGERSELSLASAVVSTPETEIQSHSSSMLLGGLAGALAFAGLLGFAAVKSGNLSSLLHVRRSGLIEDLVSHSPPPWLPKDSDTAQTSRSDLLRKRREIEAQSRDIMEILSRASRGATT